MSNRIKHKSLLLISLIIFILFSLGILFVFISNINSIDTNKDELSYVSETIRTSVESCIKSKAEQGLFMMGTHSGFVLPHEPSISDGKFSLTYLLYEEKELLPPISYYQGELSGFVSKGLVECLDNLSFLDERGFDVIYSYPRTTVSFLSDKINIRTIFDITISDGSKSISVNDFSISLPVRMMDIYYVVNTIIKKTIYDPTIIQTSYLNSLDMDMFVLPLDDGSIIYALIDSESKIAGNNYVFMFALKPDSDSNEFMPILLSIPDFEVEVGDTLLYDTNPFSSLGHIIDYSLSSPIFNSDIDNYGQIRITPSIEDIGNHKLRVDVTNLDGETSSTYFIVEVVP